MKTLLALITSLTLSGYVTLGYQGWIAQHSLEIGQVGLVAGTVASVESAANGAIQLEHNVVK